MTQIQHITGKEMLRRTGVNALGYTYPDKDLILLKKGLTGKIKRNVLSHELDHLEKGEEGPLFGIDDALLGGGISALGSFFGGKEKSKGASKALAYQNQARAETREDLEPYRTFGTNRLGDYQSWLGSPQGQFRFQAPGFGGQPNVFSQPRQERLGADQIRSNLLASGQFNQAGRGAATPADIYQQGDTIYVPESLRGTGGYHDYGLVPQHYGSLTSGDLGIEYIPDRPTGGGIDEAGLSAAIQAQLSQQNQQNQDTGYGGDFRTDPAYQFRLSEGQRALENSAAARGGLLSGNTLRGITDYSQDAASQEYGKIYDREYRRQMDEYLTDYQRKYGDVGLGYSAAAGGAALNLAGAGQAGQAAIGVGQARAEGISNVFGSIAGGIGQYQGQQQWQDFLDRAYPTTTTV